MSTQPLRVDSEAAYSDNNSSLVHILREASALVDNRGLVVDVNTAMQQTLLLKNVVNGVGIHIGVMFPCITNQLSFPLFSNSGNNHLLALDSEQLDERLYFQPFFTADQHLFVLNSEFAHETDENLLELVLESIPARVFWKDLNCRFLGCNTLFAQDAGHDSPEQLIGNNDHDAFSAEAELYIADDLEVMHTGRAKLNIEEPLTTADGKETWVSTNKVPIRNSEGDVIGLLGSYTDITERVQYQKRIEHQARFDHLTALPNRLALKERIESFSKADTPGRGGLLFIDLDYFKTVNDSLGHEVGDQLLIQVARRITKAVDGRGFVARLGGDEFSVFATDLECESKLSNKKQIENVANDVCEEITHSYTVGLHTIRLGVSIGITEFDHATTNWADKFNEADIAMYEAKATGRNRVMRFDGKMRDKLQRSHSVKSKLVTACENDELYLVVQPQNNKDGQWLGGEGLLRWNNAALGIVSPSEFIHVAEQSGIIHQLGLYVFEQAFRLVNNLSEKHDQTRLMPLAVNVSARQFQHRNFVHDITALLKKTGVAAELIQFELTESLLLENQDDVLAKLRELSDMGFTLAIDDFGTGYSSLNYISKLPIDKLKIDQSFTRQIGTCRRQAAIVETIILMAKNLGMSVIAEGVETKHQLEILLQLGCLEFQGYYFHRPMPMPDYISWLEKTTLR